MTSSDRWLEDMQRQLRRGKHVILHGNVRDLALWQDEFQTFGEAVDAALVDLGFSMLASYDPSGRFEFARAKDREIFMRAQPGSEVTRPGGSGTLPGRRQATPVEDETISADESGPVEERSLAAPDVAIHAIRNALSGIESERLVVRVSSCEKLFNAGENQGPAERLLMLVLELAADDAHRHLSGRCAGMRNSLVLVTPSLGQLPASLYREHPLFSVIQVDKPMGDARREYLRQTYRAFRGGDSDAPGVELTELFTALTDGFAYWDLEALRLASHHAAIDIQSCRRLVDFFKHGIKDDPWRKLALRSRHEVESYLNERVVGQEEAVAAVADVLISAIGGIHADGPGQRSVRPKGVLFFVGPTGVGKTELAKRVTELVFGEVTAFARFDMSEYQQEHAAERLTGAPPSYVGYEAGGQLTNHMKRRPFSVILFDEIEKAHPRVLDKFLQVLDDGRLTDGQGETVYFAQSLLIFTSNIGSTVRGEKPGDGPLFALRSEMAPGEVKAHFKKAVREHFITIGRPELLGRIGEENVVPFDLLRTARVSGILDKFMRGVEEQLKEQYGLRLVYDDAILAHAQAYCAEPENGLLGGRALRNFVEKLVTAPINEIIIRPPAERPSQIALTVEDGRVVASWQS